MCRGLFLILRTIKLLISELFYCLPQSKDRTMTSEHKIKEQIKNMQESYIYIDTELKRKGKSMHQLYKEGYKKRIQVRKESLVFLNLTECLDMVQGLIKEHRIQTQGDLGIFGPIRFYYYRHCDGNIFGFDKCGERL